MDYVWIRLDQKGPDNNLCAKRVCLGKSVTLQYCSVRTCEILENYNCSLLRIFRTASGTVLFDRGAIGFSSSITFQNALNRHNQTITSEITLFLVIATICARFVISVFFSSVIDHDPPAQIHRYYGMIFNFR